jgi:hypothetical protein
MAVCWPSARAYRLPACSFQKSDLESEVALWRVYTMVAGV